MCSGTQFIRESSVCFTLVLACFKARASQFQVTYIVFLKAFACLGACPERDPGLSSERAFIRGRGFVPSGEHDDPEYRGAADHARCRRLDCLAV